LPLQLQAVVSLCMGSEGEQDITQISLHFQGLSISVTRPLEEGFPEVPSAWLVSAKVYPAKQVQVRIVDFEASVCICLSALTGAAVDYVAFDPDDPTLFPLAVEVVAASLAWLRDRPGNRGAAGYVTAEELPADPLVGPALGKQAKARPAEKGKKPTLAGLAAQQTALQDLVVTLVDKVQALTDSQAAGAQDVQGPLALELPGEEALPDIMQEELQQGSGEPLAQAMLLHTKALSSLVSQLSSGSGESLLDSNGGGAGSLQGPVSQGTMTQYLERFGGYSRDRSIGLAQWQCGLAMDLLSRGEARGAADTIAMMMVFFEQTSLDGSPDLAWLLTHLPDPPNGLFMDRTTTPTTTLRPFSPLADQRLLATTLAYVKELDALTAKRNELPKPKAPTKPAPPTKGDPGGDEAALSRKFPVHLPVAPRLLLATKTSFSRLLLASFAVRFHEGEPPPPTALFPLPVPSPGAFSRDAPKHCSRSVRRALLLGTLVDRCLHIAVMALNHAHADGRALPFSVLRRRPSPEQCNVFARLRLFIEASTRQPFDFPLSGGRRGAHLLARLDELSTYLKACGISQAIYPGCSEVKGLVPHDESGPAALQPYREAVADRLLISGRGHWDVSAYLGPELLLPYREPSVLRGIPENSLCYPDTSKESKEEMLRVFSLWDSLGLLSLTPAPAHPKSLCRIFGAFKTPSADRMIGDRRGPNALEGRLCGVSSDLPQGFLLAGLSVPQGFALCGASTDRSDYYHQIWTTPQRTASNAVGPPLRLSELRATRAHDEFIARAVAGLGSARNGLLGRDRKAAFEFLGPDPIVCGAFRAILQGDHSGVEIATAAHEGLLEGRGLLAEDKRIVASRPPPISTCAEALVIDDFFAVCLVDAYSLKGLEGEALSRALQTSTATQCVFRAKEAYAGAQLAGSDHKDNLGSLTFTAEVCSELGLVEQGAVLVGAPLQRRLALSYVSLKAAALPGTSEELVSSLLGAWVSYIQFRRPFACFLDTAFKLGAKKAHPSGSPARPLPRKAACELSLLAACAPLPASNIAVPYDDHVYCADASLAKGAFCKARVGKDISEAVWHSGTRGGHTRLGSPQLDDPCPETPAELLGGPRGEGPLPKEPATAKARPLGMDYDFVEVFSATGAVSDAAKELGLRVGPRLSLSASEEFDFLRAHVLDWLLYLISRGRLRSLYIKMPAGSFSRAFRPRCRSVLRPSGFGPLPAKVRLENRLASRALFLLKFCQRCGVPCILSCAAGSFFFELPLAKAVRGSERFRFLPSVQACCGAGASCHLSFLTTGVPLAGGGPCQIAGQPFEHALACLFRSALAARREPEIEPRPGLESALADDVLLTSNWEVCSSWRWPAKKHINVFESDAALSFYKRLALEGGDRRCALISDSAVVVGSHRKGRSSARLLRASLKRVGTTTIAGGLYTSLVFGPTRWNPSDDPTRDAPLRTPSGIAVCSGLTREELRDLSSLRGLSRPRANWVRLALVLVTVAFDHPSRLVSALRSFPSGSRFAALPEVFSYMPLCHQAFDRTLGYPGEGPSLCLAFGFLLLWICTGTLIPRNPDDFRRLDRRLRPLPPGRPVQAATSSRRAVLISGFSQWLLEVVGKSLEETFAERPFDTEGFVELLVFFGRDLYNSGRPYWHFSETINGLTARKPTIRRSCQAAWDLAFTWLSEEPSSHHVAMPPIVLMAIITACLAWGWTREAGIFALAWGALLRISEATQACRGNLIFPEDALFMQSFILVRIDQPKTRGRAAKHQSGKLEASDLVSVASLAFLHLPKTAKLWPYTNQTLRRRLDSILDRLGIPKSGAQGRSLDLGSLRPGGATHLLQLTEDSELVRRRGRWASHKVMEIYLQEVSSSTFIMDLPETARTKVLSLAHLFPGTLAQAHIWATNNIPSKCWRYLWP
ncbi:unnamed protein product, partial [Symbiodinium microadriaticum]